jgi:FkbM family methyltransferase
MPSILRALRLLIRHKAVYRDTAAAWQAMQLRLKATEHGQGDAAVEKPLRLRNLPAEIFVREGTSDFLVVRSLFEKEAYRAAKRMSLPPDAAILDLGANIGISVLYFSTFLPAARFLAVEPDAANCRLIERNCHHLIRQGRLQIVRAFVGAEDGAAGIDRQDGSWAFRKTSEPGGGESIPCASVPTLMKHAGFARADAIKCNIEGSEVEVFRTCRPWIGAVENLIVEAHRPYTLDDLQRDLRQAGWECEMIWQKVRSETAMGFLKRRA